MFFIIDEHHLIQEILGEDDVEKILDKMNDDEVENWKKENHIQKNKLYL